MVRVAVRYARYVLSMLATIGFANRLSGNSCRNTVDQSKVGFPSSPCLVGAREGMKRLCALA